jgi:hypothetical protein
MTRHELTRLLSFIRYLYIVGEKQSTSPFPYCAISILSFHDCLEWFLITACEHLNVNIQKSAGLLGYFGKLQERDMLFNGPNDTQQTRFVP